MKKYILVVEVILVMAAMLLACGAKSVESKEAYGVFLSCTYDELPEECSNDTLVIDAQYYTKREITELKKTNGEVYSYLNLGSIEDFRDYFDKFDDLILGPYENWDEEYWVNVADERWQDFLVDVVASELADKGVDGFFIDNTDVYYNYPGQDIFDGITNILTRLKSMDKGVIINGGDTYVSRYLNEYGDLDAILDGVNQESVYSSINWDDETFGVNDDDTREYYLNYLAKVKADGKDVYLLEYTTDSSLKKTIQKNSNKLGYKYYISDSLELD